MYQCVDEDTGEVVRVVRRPWERRRVPTIIEGESMTLDSHRDLTDINFIFERYCRTGVLPPPRQAPVFADVSGLNRDLTELINESAAALDGARSNNEKLGERKRSQADSSTSSATTSSPGSSSVNDNSSQ